MTISLNKTADIPALIFAGPKGIDGYGYGVSRAGQLDDCGTEASWSSQAISARLEVGYEGGRGLANICLSS
jgi:hypothetical protein